MYKSHTMGVYKNSAKMASIPAERIPFVDDLYCYAERHYNNGGSALVEAVTPWEANERYTSLEQLKAEIEGRGDVEGDQWRAYQERMKVETKMMQALSS